MGLLEALMTADVIITVKGYHNIGGSDQEPVITSARGKYCFRNGHHFVSYEEETVEGSAPAKSLVKFGEHFLSIHRKGEYPSRMELEEGKRNLSRYRTPAGILEFGLEAEQISFREEEGLLEVEALYTLHSGEEPIQKSRVVVTVRNI